MIGVVLMTYGAPRGRADVASYVTRVRGGRVPPDDLVEEMTRRYEQIGWSPIVERTVAQAEALETELASTGSGVERGQSPLREEGHWHVAAGMRYSLPTIGEAVEVLAAAGAERLVGIVMSPQWSPTLMSGYERALGEAVAMLRTPLPIAVAHEWHREASFIDALAERTREALARIDGARVPVLLTAHSLPKRVYDSEPDYIAQLLETGALVARRAGLAEGQWQWAYQSAGHTAEEWLRPDLKELFPALAAAGHRDVLVVPVQFLADHLEVLYDLDIAAAKEAERCGLRYHRIEMPNTQPMFVRALASVARRTAGAPVPA